MPFLSANQQHQSTEETSLIIVNKQSTTNSHQFSWTI